MGEKARLFPQKWKKVQDREKEKLDRPITRIIHEGNHKRGLFSLLAFREYIKKSPGGRIREAERSITSLTFYCYFYKTMLTYKTNPPYFSECKADLTGTPKNVDEAERIIKRSSRDYKKRISSRSLGSISNYSLAKK